MWWFIVLLFPVGGLGQGLTFADNRTWDLHAALNCYKNHGGDDMEVPTGSDCGDMSVTECEAKCLITAGCTAIVVDTETTACYRRRSVNLANCDKSFGKTYDTYTLKPLPPTPAPPTPPTPPTPPSSWTQYKNTNCYGGGHGAKDLEGGGKDCGSMPLEACQAKCDQLKGCFAITWSTKTQKCYRRGYIMREACDNQTEYDTWVSYANAVPTPTPAGISIRVAKGLGTRGYDTMRLSLIRYDAEQRSSESQWAKHNVLSSAVSDLKWSYSQKFQYRWTFAHLSSSLVNVTPGVAQNFRLDGNVIKVKIPKRTDGSIGILIGDPCIKSPWSDSCSAGENYRNKQVLQGVLNGMAIHDDLDYWVLMGDLFYDKSGIVTKEFFKGLSLEASAQVQGVTMGNHDYWFGGSPPGDSGDSFGNGHMQWYAQDTMASETNASQPFDFSIHPSTGKKAAIENFIWYNMVGNVAMLGFSNAYSWKDSLPHFQKACKWIAFEQPALVIIIGHWNGNGMGCPSGMDTNHVYASIKSVEGCDNLGDRLKYFEGHQHCNYEAKKNTGWVLGSFGYDDSSCNQFGLPILDTRNGRVKLNYFDLGDKGTKVSNFDEILGCISAKGYSACEHYATAWLDQPLNSTTY